MNLRKVKQIMWGIFGAMALSLLIAALTDSVIFVVLGTILLLVFIGFNFSMWRCPYCGEYLGRDTKNYCPNCCHELEDLKEDPK